MLGCCTHHVKKIKKTVQESLDSTILENFHLDQGICQ